MGDARHKGIFTATCLTILSQCCEKSCSIAISLESPLSYWCFWIYRKYLFIYLFIVYMLFRGCKHLLFLLGDLTFYEMSSYVKALFKLFLMIAEISQIDFFSVLGWFLKCLQTGFALSKFVFSAEVVILVIIVYKNKC